VDQPMPMPYSRISGVIKKKPMRHHQEIQPEYIFFYFWFRFYLLFFAIVIAILKFLELVIVDID
jgi:hypothetical protein